MKHFIILFKPQSLDDRVELDIVESDNYDNAMWKWIEEKRNHKTKRHFSGVNKEPINKEDVILFERDYNAFREKYYKASKYFGYN